MTDKHSSQKILFVLQNLEGGGAEKVFVFLMNRLAQQEVKIELLLGKKEGVYFDLLDKRIVMHTLDAHTVAGYLRKLRPFFRTHKYDYVVTASQNISVPVILAKKIYGLSFKIMATLHYNLPVQLSLIQRKLSRLYSIFVNKRVITKADKLVAVSKGVAEGFSAITGFPREKINVIYNPAFDNTIFGKARAALDLSFENAAYIITVGRLEYQKNHQLLINAFAEVLKKKKDLQLIILGKGSLEEELITLVKKLRIEANVHFLGFRDNPYVYLRHAKCFVLSSQYEGLPTVIIESMALGTNVVSTDCPSGPYELLEAGRLGWLSPVNDMQALADNILEAIDHPKDPQMLAEAANTYFADNAAEDYIQHLGVKQNI